MNLVILWLASFWLIGVKFGTADDIVVNSTVVPAWSSLKFLIPFDVPHNYFWALCRVYSIYYCLDAFVTEREGTHNNPAFEVRNFFQGLIPSDPVASRLKKLKRFIRDECDDLFVSKYEHHNYFVLTEGCCQGQYYYYFTYGYRDALLTPLEYISKLFDYSAEGKQLNYILSYYDPSCEANIITKIGFGIGELKRANHRSGFRDERQGIPYLLKVGDRWTPKIPYENPVDFITFSWFKTNVMCSDQPWICGSQRNSSPKGVMRWWQRIFGRRRNYSNLGH